MYNASTLKSSLLSLIGWQQNIDPTGTQLTGILTSDSGLYYNDFHPLLTIDNLESIAPDYTRITSPTQTFSQWLQAKTEAGIVQAIEAWVSRKSKLSTGNSLIERNKLFNATGRIEDTITDTGKVVGIEIAPKQASTTKVQIEKIGLQFTATENPITIKLFSADQKAAVQTEAVNYTGAGSVQWVDVNWEIDGDKTYFLAYDQADVTTTAINGVKDYTAQGNGIEAYPTSKFFMSSAFAVDGDVSTLWDISQHTYSYDTNYGLNIQYSVYCDYTDLIVEQKNLFKTAIGLQVAILLLEEMANNSNARTNRHDTNFDKDRILYHIDGDTQGRKGGLRHRFEEALNAIQFDNSGIDKVCLPCRRRGIRFKTV